MLYVIDVAVLLGLILIQIELERPFVSASIYSCIVVAVAVVALAAGAVSFVEVLLRLPINVAIAFLYFWLLDRIETLSAPWWGVLLVGFALLIFVV